MQGDAAEDMSRHEPTPLPNGTARPSPRPNIVVPGHDAWKCLPTLASMNESMDREAVHIAGPDSASRRAAYFMSSVTA